MQSSPIQSNPIQSNPIQSNPIQYNTIQYNTIQYNTIKYNTIQYNTIQYNTIQYNTIQYNTIQYNRVVTPEQGILFGFSHCTPEQGDKFKTPVAHTCLIKVESPPWGRQPLACLQAPALTFLCST